MSTDDFPDLDSSFAKDKASNDSPSPGQAQPGQQPSPYWQFPPYPGQYIPQAPRPQSQLAIWSIVLSGLGFSCCALTSIPGVITGHIALRRIKQSDGYLEGKTLALVGVILGYVMIALLALYILFLVLVTAIPHMTNDHSTYGPPPQPPTQERPVPEPDIPYTYPNTDDPSTYPYDNERYPEFPKETPASPQTSNKQKHPEGTPEPDIGPEPLLSPDSNPPAQELDLQ